MPVLMSSAALPVENYSGLIVKTIPGRCENPFAFTPEPLFTISPGIVFIFIPERFSRSPRNPVHLAPESAHTYNVSPKGKYVTGPLVTGSGKLGPRFPQDENPHDLVFS